MNADILREQKKSKHNEHNKHDEEQKAIKSLCVIKPPGVFCKVMKPKTKYAKYCI